MISDMHIKDEKHLRALIMKGLRKEVWPNTRPSIDFIFKTLEEAYTSRMVYDVRDLRQKIFTFAMRSTNQKEACLEIMNKMHFCSEEDPENSENYEDDRIVFFDCEVYSNLFIICWKYKDADDVVKMINPSPQDVGELFKMKLIGFNNRRYDNHILWARYLGYDNLSLYNLSQKIISYKKEDSREDDGHFKEAYNISYADVYDFCAKKQSLKKWEIDLGIPHKEMPIPWDEPAPEDRWLEICEYCSNDVRATEAVFNARYVDFETRVAVAKLSGLTVNDTTLMHAIKFIFGNNKYPKLVWTNLATGEQSVGR